ncbi:MAG: hypothetical protein ABIC57_01025 [bacterium]
MPQPDLSKLASTQEHLDVESIQEDLVILKDGTFSIVLQTTAVNFDLLSEPEQDAKIMSFGQLLNSLNHSFQILIRTKTVNIGNYIDYLKSFEKKQLSPGLMKQIGIYTNFVQNLIIKNEVLDKSFYIVVSYRTFGPVKPPTPMSQLKKEDEKQLKNAERQIGQAKSYLFPKRDHIAKQLQRIGLQSHQLTTKELIELFYEIYNPVVNKIDFTEDGE